jgi:polysaccharide transporter, PST family
MIDLPIRRNIYSLFLLQGGSYIVPLLTLPWLTRVLNVDGFGKLGFVTAFIAYFVLLVDWGFSLSATKQIAIHRQDMVARSQIFWETLLARLVLAGIGFLLLLILLVVIPGVRSETSLFLLAYLSVCASVLNPAFYYQGIEQMGQMSLINLLVKFLSVPCIFLFVTNSFDIGLAIGIQAGFIFLAAVINFLVLLLSRQLVWSRPSMSHVYDSLGQGWPLFLSTASISLYTNSNTVILGLISNPTAVGYFTAAQTIIRAGQGLYGPVSQALFPRMSHLFHHSKDSALLLLRRVLWMQGVATGLMSLALLLLAPWVVSLLFGSQYHSCISVLRWLSPLLFLIGLSNIFGIQGLVPLGYTRAFSRILLISGVLNITLIVPLGYWFLADGAAIAVLITELFVTALMGFYLASKEPKLFKIQA